MSLFSLSFYHACCIQNPACHYCFCLLFSCKLWKVTRTSYISWFPPRVCFKIPEIKTVSSSGGGICFIMGSMPGN